ncbi:MAG TPA: hypothetical protein VIZ58_08230 [Thermoanaerobaculia bacterium]
MKRLARIALALVAFTALPLVARADCKKCGGRTCLSVADLEAGNDACRIKVEEIMHVGSNGAWIEWHYTCEPSGDACTNLHVSITVPPSPGWQQVGSGF